MLRIWGGLEVENFVWKFNSCSWCWTTTRQMFLRNTHHVVRNTLYRLKFNSCSWCWRNTRQMFLHNTHHAQRNTLYRLKRVQEIKIAPIHTLRQKITWINGIYSWNENVSHEIGLSRSNIKSKLAVQAKYEKVEMIPQFFIKNWVSQDLCCMVRYKI